MKHLAVLAALSLFGSAFALFETPTTDIIIDAGHGGFDPGSTSEEIREADVNLQWALELKEMAEEKGFRVTLVRTDDTFMDLNARKKVVSDNAGDDAIVISIHQNNHTNPEIGGSRIHISPFSADRDHVLASQIASEINALSVTQIDTADLYIIRELEIPGVVLSPGFMSNKKDFENITSADYRREYNTRLLNALK